MLSLLLFMHIEDLYRVTVTGLTCDATSEPPQSYFSSKWTSLGRMAGLVIAAATLPSRSQLHYSVRNGVWLCHYGASSMLPCLWPGFTIQPLPGTLLTPNLKNIVGMREHHHYADLDFSLWDNYRNKLCLANKSDCAFWEGCLGGH